MSADLLRRGWSAAVLVVVVLGVAAWRAAATAYACVERSAGISRAERAQWLGAGFAARLDATIGGDAEIVRQVDAHVPRDAIVLVYGVDAPGAPSIKNRVVLLRLRLQSLLYPLRVLDCVGPIVDEAQYAPLLTDSIWMLDVTPGAARPFADAFEPVVTTRAFELLRCRGRRP